MGRGPLRLQAACDLRLSSSELGREPSIPLKLLLGHGPVSSTRSSFPGSSGSLQKQRSGRTSTGAHGRRCHHAQNFPARPAPTTLDPLSGPLVVRAGSVHRAQGGLCHTEPGGRFTDAWERPVLSQGQSAQASRPPGGCPGLAGAVPGGRPPAAGVAPTSAQLAARCPWAMWH